MFIGHYGVGMAAKRLAPGVSLGTLFLAVQFIDLLWPVFLLLGWEHVRIAPGATAVTPLDFYDYPVTHSLLGASAWAALLAGSYLLVRRKGKPGLVVGAGVLSHWVLDAVVHRPDLPLIPGGAAKIGLGLWNYPPGTVAVEGALFLLGLILYVRATAARDAVGRYGFWALMVLLGALYLANLTGPPPPSVTALALVGLGQWLFVVWAYWVDSHRKLVGE